MYSKFLLSSLILTIAIPALSATGSGFQSTGKPASLHCVGSEGELTLQANEQLKTFELAVTIGQSTTLIEIDGIKAQQAHAAPRVSITSFTYDDPNKNFVSIDASFEKPKWFPPYDSCTPSRSPSAPCLRMHNDGYWSTASTNEVLIGFKINPTNDGTYIMDVLRAESYGVGGLDQAPLGQNVICTGELL